jgi:hypothetical protein
VIGGKNVFPDEAGVVVVIVVMGGVRAHGSGVRRVVNPKKGKRIAKNAWSAFLIQDHSEKLG